MTEWTWKICPACGGPGRFNIDPNDYSKGTMDCPTCKGNGRLPEAGYNKYKESRKRHHKTKKKEHKTEKETKSRMFWLILFVVGIVIGIVVSLIFLAIFK